MAVGRAVVLGGGGLTGYAWELGVLAGLAAEGVPLSGADAIFGTSAGAFAGAVLASGQDIEGRYDEMLGPDEGELTSEIAPDLRARYDAVFAAHRGDRAAMGRAFGEIARSANTVEAQARLDVVRKRLKTTAWPTHLSLTAIDADTGALAVLDHSSGLTLAEAAAASSAVPGVWPMVHAGGRNLIDGGMQSPTNAQLAWGYGRIVIITPSAEPPLGRENVREVARQLNEQIAVVILDAKAREAIGANVLDPSARPAAAREGRRQGGAAAAEVRSVWLA
jgi:NTE family protein